MIKVKYLALFIQQPQIKITENINFQDNVNVVS